MMVVDDIIYISLLIICVVCGPYVKSIPSPKEKQLLSTLIGLVVVFIVSGLHIIHPLIVTVVNAFVILFVDKKKCHIVSFVFSFLYLVFFRLVGYCGLPTPPPHTNAVQMILTLKMVGLAFEVNMLHLLQQNPDKGKSLKEKYTRINPSFFDIIQYAFCFAGVMIGPYYKYRTYHDAYYAQYASRVKSERFLWERIYVVPIYVCLYLLGSYFFPLEFASSEEILEKPFWYRAFYMTPIFFNFRMRIYVGFILGECICLSMGLGAYPVDSNPQPGAGPLNYEVLEKMENEVEDWSTVPYSFETVKNIDEYGSEFLPTIREGIRSWNRTVQYWLATFVYKRISGSKPVKVLITMSVSAFWHGVHAGYYLCLMSAPLFLFVETEVEKAFRKNVSGIRLVLFNWIWYVIKMQSFAYMGMAFLLLEIGAILHFWRSIYFVGHFAILAIYVFALSYNKYRKKRL